MSHGIHNDLYVPNETDLNDNNDASVGKEISEIEGSAICYYHFIYVDVFTCCIFHVSEVTAVGWA